MSTKFLHRRKDLLNGFRELRTNIPDVMSGFGQLHKAGMAPGVLSAGSKELIAVGIAVATNCGGCITLHVHGALKAGATPQEVSEAIGVAIVMGGGAAAVSGTEAIEALQQFKGEQFAAQLPV